MAVAGNVDCDDQDVVVVMAMLLLLLLLVVVVAAAAAVIIVAAELCRQKGLGCAHCRRRRSRGMRS